MKYSIEELKLLVVEYGKTIDGYDRYEEIYAKWGEIKTGYAMDFIKWLENNDKMAGK